MFWKAKSVMSYETAVSLAFGFARRLPLGMEPARKKEGLGGFPNIS